MKITVINGTEVKGCTYHIKEIFLAPLRDKNEITEFYLPKDMPHFCCGCKACFFEGAGRCPHVREVEPIWTAIKEADLLVFTAPVYVLGIPASLKALLDHLTVRWMVHCPEPAMFSKSAVILTSSIGATVLTKPAQRDVVNSVAWMGISKTRRLAIGLMEGVIWDELSDKRREKIENEVRRFGQKHADVRPAGKSPATRFKFFICKTMHAIVLKKEDVPSSDNRHWIEQGWLKAKP